GESLRRRGDDLGVAARMVFTGGILHADVPAHLRAMDVAVAPFEAMPGFYFSPLKVAEYLAAGRAVIASCQGDIPDLMDGAGLLWEPGDVESLAAALRSLAADPELR